MDRGKKPEMKQKDRSSPSPGQPGPNSFALAEQRLHQHRLNSNAFYQQEFLRRKDNPPTDVHPALRERKLGENSPPLLFKDDFIDGDYRKGPKKMAEAASETSSNTSSTITTMSPFVNAGAVTSPALKLVPSMVFDNPTQRAIIEDERESIAHARAGGAEQRIPVYTLRPSPKVVQPAEFSKSTGSVPRLHPLTAATTAESIKSPRKTIFQRLGLSKKSGSSTATPAPESEAATPKQVKEDSIPVKAQSLLGASPAKSSLGRRISNKKSFFSRRTSDIDDATSTARPDSTAVPPHFTQPQARSSVGHKRNMSTPYLTEEDQKKFNDRTSKQISADWGIVPDRGQFTYPSPSTKKVGPAVTRTQSLKYFNPEVPPTPPAKNTPPEDKIQTQKEEDIDPFRINHYVSTPTKRPAAVVSNSDDVSPTKYGTYAHSGTATLVTQPSMYSLHASVVPESIDPAQFEDLKTRIDGLNIEGFNMPSENIRSPTANEVTYSPSIYESEWKPTPSPYDGPRTKCGHPLRHTLDDLPEMSEDGQSQISKRLSSSSSTGTITIALSPSLHAELVAKQANAHRESFMSDDTTLVGSPDSTLTNQDAFYSPFADNTEDLTQALDKAFKVRRYSQLSPIADYKHQGTVPAPLEVLPAKRYETSPTPTFKLRNKITTPNKEPEKKSTPMKQTPRAQDDVFTPSRNSTYMLSGGGRIKDPRQRHSIASPIGPPPSVPLPAIPVDPTMREVLETLKEMKQNQSTMLNKKDLQTMETVLKHVNERHEQMTEMYTEMLLNNARMDVRLENIDRTPKSRVTTEFSHEFYKKDAVAINQAQIQGETLVNYARSPEGRARRGSERGVGEEEKLRELEHQNKVLQEQMGELRGVVEELKGSMRGR